VVSTAVLNIDSVVEAVGMWESRRDFQEEWEGWEAGSMAFHPFHSSSFPPLGPGIGILAQRGNFYCEARLAGADVEKLTAQVRCGYGSFSLFRCLRGACCAFTRSGTTVRECCHQALGIEHFRRKPFAVSCDW
jgi:hypothetical protein